MPTVNQIIWLAFLVGIPAALAFHYLRDGARSRVMRAFAARHGLGYEATSPSVGDASLLRLPIFDIGADRKFLNVISGSVGGRQIQLFDYRHRVGGLLTTFTSESLIADGLMGVEKNRKPTWYNMTVVAFRTPGGGEPTRSTLPGMPGGHTRVEQGRGWTIVYRFDRRVPEQELDSFLQRSLGQVERAA